ncbi:hypothetical protein BOTBODRAFT_34331 [Botryobasidium botryosum FD-172 SS1]|uniref:F-box domain-containing protein n=1 Tax=Botryobasidium botryosum (strain FD-172 SS1) TaxID=930990 RepID=A0A067MA02_BOTB1|nr:hypothetical protein BOTBODRAFT_34331 [Botryobasidium botryosum FD-172 SS1]
MASPQLPSAPAVDDHDDGEYQLDDDEDDEAYAPQSRASRRRRRSAATTRPRKKAKVVDEKQADPPKRSRRKAGMLAPLITSMPLEILFEILSNLLPIDLLHLSWTNKAFRGILLRRSSIVIWEAARAQVPDLPECPADLNEVQYANLVFGTHCHECGKPNVRKVEWALRMRLCEKCRETMLGRIPFGEYDIQSCLSKATTTLKRHRNSPMYALYYRPHIDEALEQRNALEGAHRTMWELRRKIAVCETKQHAIRCELWWNDTTDKRATQLEECREKRLHAIEERLIDLGWGEELQYHSLAQNPHVRQPKELTDRIWQNIRDPLVLWLTELRKQRLKVDKFNVLLQKYLGYLRGQKPSCEVFPTIEQLADLEIIKPLWVNDSLVVDPESFSDIVERLPEIVQSWRDSIDARFAALVPTSSKRRNQASPKDILSLATTVFITTESKREAFFYPDMLHHEEFNGKRLNYAMWYIGEYKLYDDTRVPCGDPPEFMFEFDVERSSTAKELLRAAGLNARTTTWSDMDRLDARFACLGCATSKRAWVMSWRKALDHSRKCTPRVPSKNIENPWYCLSIEERKRIRGLELNQRLKNPFLDFTFFLDDDLIDEENDDPFDDDYLENFVCTPERDFGFGRDEPQRMWSCNHCRDVSPQRCLFEMEELKLHLNSKHNVSKPVEGTDYMDDPNGRVVGPRPVPYLLKRLGIPS